MQLAAQRRVAAAGVARPCRRTLPFTLRFNAAAQRPTRRILSMAAAEVRQKRACMHAGRSGIGNPEPVSSTPAYSASCSLAARRALAPARALRRPLLLLRAAPPPPAAACSRPNHPSYAPPTT
jgi:hypothetical protein